MPERQSTLSYTNLQQASNIPTWLNQLGGSAGEGRLGSFVLAAFFPSSFSLFAVCNFKSRSRYPKRSKGHTFFTLIASWTQHRDRFSLSH